MDHFYDVADVNGKRQIISSIYPDNLVFDGNTYRTKRLNEAVRLIYTLGKGFNEKENRKNEVKTRISGWVVPTGIEPVSKV